MFPQINGAQLPSNLLIERKGAGEKERERLKIRNERGPEKEGKREKKWVRSAVKNAVVG